MVSMQPRASFWKHEGLYTTKYFKEYNAKLNHLEIWRKAGGRGYSKR